MEMVISNENNLRHQEAWNWEGIFKCTDDHIFEKTLKIELSPIPQAYTLKSTDYVIIIIIMSTTIKHLVLPFTILF
jgi:hypothetical protein